MNDVVTRCAQTRDIPVPPVTLLKSDRFQAYAEDGELFFSPIVLSFPPDILIAIVHHELEHVQRRHGRYSYPLSILAVGASVVLLTGIALNWFPDMSVMCIFVAYACCMVSRHYNEFQADAASAEYGTLNGMLRLYTEYAEPVNRRWYQPFANRSHPSHARRIRHLRRCVKQIEGQS